MKKVLLTAVIAAAFVFGMASCNCKKNAEPEQECTEQTEEVCNHECEHPACICDSACAENHCEGCTNEECKAKCCMHKCCKEGEKCCKDGDKACCKDGEKACCKDGEKKCCKDGEKKECCKK